MGDLHPPRASCCGRKIAALLEKTHVVLERGYHVLVGHLATALARLLGLFTVGLEPPPADFEAPATFVAALLLDGVAGVLKGVNTGTWSLLGRGTELSAGW